MGERGNEVRVGDRDRDRAIALLGEHFSAGRLDIEEFDDRCTRAAAARFRSELLALFEDLPEPRPELATAPPLRTDTSEANVPNPRARRAGLLAVGVSVLVVLVALAWFSRQVWLLIPVLGFGLFWFGGRR